MFSNKIIMILAPYSSLIGGGISISSSFITSGSTIIKRSDIFHTSRMAEEAVAVLGDVGALQKEQFQV